MQGHAHRINSLAINCDYALRTGYFQLGISNPTKGNSQNIDTNNEIDTESNSLLLNIALEKYNAVIGNGTEILVSCSDDFTVYMWKPQESKSPITRMVGHQQIVNHIAFSPGKTSKRQ